MQYLKLIGILIIILGFAFKLETVATVVVAAVVTALCSGMNITQTLAIIGKSFTDNRMVTLFFLTLPMIGLVESNGMKVVAVQGISKLKHLTAGGLLDVYMLAREVLLFFGIAMNGQVALVRPLLAPMTMAAAEKSTKLSEQGKEKMKARIAATDNFSNFFSQNTFVAGGGVLLMASTMTSLHHAVKPSQIVIWSVPVAVIAFIVVAIYNYFCDKHYLTRKEADN